MSTIRMRRTINLAGAEIVMSVAEEYAREKGYRVVIAVVDPGGNPLLLRRLEDTQVASVNVALDKARTAAIFIRPSRVLEEQVSAGRIGALSLHGGVALIGGIPLVLDGEVVGAIGVSGETPDQDESVAIAGSMASFSVDKVPALTFEGAQMAANASAKVAISRGVAPVISVVDAHGELIYVWRPDSAQVASVNVATDKARTASLYRRPSKDFEDQASKGRPSVLALARGVPLQGGMPILFEGQVAGAIGVSGASSAGEDQELAVIGSKVIAEMNGKDIQDVFYAPNETVMAKFGTGGLLQDKDHYKVDAGRRERPGEVEFHNWETDVMYVVQGTAKVITGGEMLDSRQIAPGQIRAVSIRGGVEHDLAKGDVFVVPNGVPHQFIEVSYPFLYYVVKVVSGPGG